MPGENDAYNSEKIKTVKDLLEAYKALRKERSRLLSVFEQKQAELEANTERTYTKLTMHPDAGSSWALDPTKKNDIRELGASANITGMKLEWANAMNTLKSLKKSIEEQTNRLNNITATVEIAGLKPMDEPLPALIEEVKRCANAIEEFKNTYVQAWGPKEFEAKRRLSPPNEKEEQKASKEALRAYKVNLVKEANEQLEAWVKTRKTPEETVLDANQDEIIRTKPQTERVAQIQQENAARQATENEARREKEEIDRRKQKAEKRMVRAGEEDDARRAQQKQNEEEERKKLFEETHEQHIKSRLRRIESAAAQQHSEIKSAVVEPKAKIIEQLKIDIDNYIKEKPWLIRRSAEHDQKATCISNYLATQKPTTITPELMRHLAENTPTKEGRLLTILTNFKVTAIENGYYKEPEQTTRKKREQGKD